MTSPEANPADLAEQAMPVTPASPEPAPIPAGPEVDEADAAEQTRPVALSAEADGSEVEDADRAVEQDEEYR